MNQMPDIHYLILVGVVSGAIGIVWKIVFDWLQKKRENGHLSEIEFNVKEMHERQKKMWEAIERMEGKLK